MRVALLEPLTAVQVHAQYLLHAFPHAVLLHPPMGNTTSIYFTADQ